MRLSKQSSLASVIVLMLALLAAPVLADVTWNFTAVNVSPGTEPPVTGTITTPDPPFGFGIGVFLAPSAWPVSGQITIAAGTLGGPGEVLGINDAEITSVTIVHNGTNWLDLNYNFSGMSYQGFAIGPNGLVLTGPGGSGFWQMVSIELGDSDGDGVLDAEDVCPDTVIPESVPTVRLGVNRFALTDGDGVFDTTAPKGNGPNRSYTTEQTGGCSCAQIIAELGLGNGHTKFGCSIGAMDNWVDLVSGL